MASPEYILRDQAEALLRELGVRSPDDRVPVLSDEVDEWGDPLYMCAPTAPGHAYDRAIRLLVAGMASERHAAA